MPVRSPSPLDPFGSDVEMNLVDVLDDHLGLGFVIPRGASSGMTTAGLHQPVPHGARGVRLPGARETEGQDDLTTRSPTPPEDPRSCQARRSRSIQRRPSSARRRAPSRIASAQVWGGLSTPAPELSTIGAAGRPVDGRFSLVCSAILRCFSVRLRLVMTSFVVFIGGATITIFVIHNYPNTRTSLTPHGGDRVMKCPRA